MASVCFNDIEHLGILCQTVFYIYINMCIKCLFVKVIKIVLLFFSFDERVFH